MTQLSGIPNGARRGTESKIYFHEWVNLAGDPHSPTHRVKGELYTPTSAIGLRRHLNCLSLTAGVAPDSIFSFWIIKDSCIFTDDCGINHYTLYHHSISSVSLLCLDHFHSLEHPRPAHSKISFYLKLIWSVNHMPQLMHALGCNSYLTYVIVPNLTFYTVTTSTSVSNEGCKALCHVPRINCYSEINFYQ